MKKYVLTGGPGAGKTTIGLTLEAMGEHYIREAAEDIIRRQQSCGMPEPWKDPNFQLDILRLQQQRERGVRKDISRVFIDRGTPDGLAYLDAQSETAREILKSRGNYDRIFLIEHSGILKSTAVRRENLEEAKKLEDKLHKIYAALGYNITIIKPGTPEERAKQILEEIQ
jgi:predicted ATPase